MLCFWSPHGCPEPSPKSSDCSGLIQCCGLAPILSPSFCPPPFCEVGGDQCEPLWVRLLAFALGSTKREPQQALEGRRKMRGSGQGSFGDPVKAQGPWDRPFTRCHLSLPSLPSAPSPPLPVLTLSELSPTLDSMHSSVFPFHPSDPSTHSRAVHFHPSEVTQTLTCVLLPT